MQIIRNTYQDILNAVTSIEETTLLKIANAMFKNDGFEVVLNTPEAYKATSSYEMAKMFNEGYEFNTSEKYLIKWNHIDVLDYDCSTTDCLIDELRPRDIASFIDDNNGFEDLIFLHGNRFELSIDDEVSF
jgi:hypothetical protein